MASRRGSSGKRGGGDSGGGFGELAGKFVLYSLATVGGCYVGVKALNLIPHEPMPEKKVAARASVDGETSTLAPRRTEPRRVEPKSEDAASAVTVKEKPESGETGQLKDVTAPINDEVGRGEADNDAKPEVSIREKPASPRKTDLEAGELPAPAPVEGTGTLKSAVAKPPTPTKLAEGDVPVTLKPETHSETKTVPTRVFPPIEVDRGSTNRKEVALTFDAGSDWKPVRKIVETLAAENVKSTFFLTGEWVKKNPKSTHLIADSGHELGNHSWNHPAFTGLSDDEIKDQLRRTDEMIQETAGRSTHPYFRPPLGARDTRVRKVVGKEGYLTVYWTLDSRDSVDKGITAEQIRDRVLKQTGPGSIVLMHCGSQATADALPEIIKGLKAKGLTPVPISRLLQQ